MTRKRLAIMIILGTILMLSVLAMAVFGQGEEVEKTTPTVVQYKVVAVPDAMTQAQLQALLTTQGNAGFHFVVPLAVGTGPIPNQEVFVFSKP
jgi:hypothetical protein